MGLDIHICVDNHEEVYSINYASKYRHKHSLSRTFCDFICKKGVITGETELTQLGRLTNLDTSILQEMENYFPEHEILERSKHIENQEEKQLFLERCNTINKKLEGNIIKIFNLVSDLIVELSKIDNLPQKLNDGGYDTLNNNTYFADFNEDKGDGYIGNNFGQDLRNFKRFLEYAIIKNSTTVSFLYG